MAEYGSDGNWFVNLINWIIGMVFMYFWSFIGSYINIIGLWQVSLDGHTAVYTDFAPPEVSDYFTSSMPIGNSGSWGDSLL